MKIQQIMVMNRKGLQLLALLTYFLALPFSHAAMDLATQPLVTQSAAVPPNLVFIMDDSGSMNWDFIPDYVDDSTNGWTGTVGNCKNSSGNTFTATCEIGDPPYMSSDFNKVYYDPAIRYLPPKESDGTSKDEMNSANTSGWTIVPKDAYGIQSTSTINLTNGYPERKWCEDDNDTTTCRSNTGTANAYIYPDSTYNDDLNVSGAPYYFTVSAKEYCDSPALRSCIATTAPSGVYTYPAKIRWCTSSTIPQTNCQGKRTGTYKYVHYAGVSLTDTAATGTITIGDSGNNVPVEITSIKVDNIEILNAIIQAPNGTNTATERSALATDIANRINTYNSTPEYRATASNGVVTITPMIAPGSTTPLKSTAPNGYAIVVTAPPGSVTVPATRASESFSFSNVGKGSTHKTTEIKAGSNSTCTASGSVTLLTTDVPATNDNSGSTRRSNMARDVLANLNSVAGWSATRSGSTLTFTAPAGASYNNWYICLSETGTIEIDPPSPRLSGGANASTTNGQIPITTTSLAGGADISNPFSRVDIIPSVTSYPKTSSRSDCAGSTCSYDEEMTNFANWYAYYHTRMQMMKSSVSLAFEDIDDQFNVGYFTINNNNGDDNVDVKEFNPEQKGDWYEQLFKARPNSGTPLRAALSKAGWIFAGKNPSGFTDPMEYSCQQNFTILSTDGYWNGNNGYTLASTGTAIGNQDNDSSVARPYYDGGSATSSSNALADVAYYYYNTDLRTSALGNATNTSAKTTADVADNTVSDPNDPSADWQHMTTFTLGLGIDGQMTFSPTYTSDASGDYYNVLQANTASSTVCTWLSSGSTCNWPKAVADTDTAVDDLWHAAVNGHGTYFSAANPTAVSSALGNALTVVSRATGSSSAAATSSPNITNYDNFIFSSTYRTVSWDGEIVAQTIDPKTGQIGTLVTDPDTGQQIRDTTPLWTANELLDPRVQNDTNPRVIKTFDSGGGDEKLKHFTYAELSDTEKGYFIDRCARASSSANFSQCSILSDVDPDSQLDIANSGEHLVNFLRGKDTYESVFRNRDHVLGDTVNSVPAYVKGSNYDFQDEGYSAFKVQNSERSGTLYIGANDGMLHAFDAASGEELWAYVPKMIMPNLWTLGDANYANHHQYYVDGSPQIMDVKDDSGWRTILVSGLNRGGKGYFAMDITNPNSPKALWEFCNDSTLCALSDPDMGYSYGNPLITKLRDGTPVVIFTSGYDNGGDGYLYILHATTGSLLHKVQVDGSNGLAKIAPFISDPQHDNTALYVYGGDLDGQLWRFSFIRANEGTPPTVMKLATFTDPGAENEPQPITTRPEVGIVKVDDDFRIVVYVGTGKYIENGDPTSRQIQSLYALADNGEPYTNPRTQLQQRTISASGNSASIAVTGSGDTELDNEAGTADFDEIWNPLTAFGGWFTDFPDDRERVNLDPQLILGTLVVFTNIPQGSVDCGGQGDSWLYFFRADTGLAVKPNDSTNSPFGRKTSGITVGGVLFTLPSGKVGLIITKGSGGKDNGEVPIEPETKSRRSSWRELIN